MVQTSATRLACQCRTGQKSRQSLAETLIVQWPEAASQFVHRRFRWLRVPRGCQSRAGVVPYRLLPGA